MSEPAPRARLAASFWVLVAGSVVYFGRRDVVPYASTSITISAASILHRLHRRQLRDRRYSPTTRWMFADRSSTPSPPRLTFLGRDGALYPVAGSQATFLRSSQCAFSSLVAACSSLRWPRCHDLAPDRRCRVSGCSHRPHSSASHRPSARSRRSLGRHSGALHRVRHHRDRARVSMLSCPIATPPAHLRPPLATCSIPRPSYGAPLFWATQYVPFVGSSPICRCRGLNARYRLR